MAKLDFIVKDGKVIKDLTVTDRIVDAVDKGLHIGAGCCFNSKEITKIVVITSNEQMDKPIGIIRKGMCFFGELSVKEALEMKMELVDCEVPKYVIKNLKKYIELGRKGEKMMETTNEVQTTEAAQVTTGNVTVEEKEMAEVVTNAAEIEKMAGAAQAVDDEADKAFETVEVEVQQISAGETDKVEKSKADEEEKRRKKEELARKKYEEHLKSQEKWRNKLFGEGCKQLDKNTMVLAEDLTGEYMVFIRVMKSITDNQRKYLIAERDRNGIERGTESKSALFTAYDIKRGATKIDNWISGFEGMYDGMMGDIKRRMTIVEEKRLLVTASILKVGEKTFEQIFADLEKWFQDNLGACHVGCCKIKGEYHVGIVRRGQKTPDKLFKDVFKVIAPENSYEAFKRELYRRDLVFHDSSEKGMDFQKGLSKAAMVRLGVVGDKMISIKFDERVRKEMYAEYCISRDLDLDFEDMIFDENSAA